VSLINDTLKDLEERWPQADAGLTDNSRDVSLEGASALTDRGKPHAGRWYLIGSGVVVFVLLVWFGKFYGPQSASTDPAAIASPVEAHLVKALPPLSEAQSTPLPNELAPQTADALDTEDAAQVKDPPQSQPSHRQRLLQLVLLGDQALAQDRLTTPRHDNAYDRYLAALALEPDNPEAKDGLRRVGERYLELMRLAGAEGRHQDVERLAERAQEVGVDNERLQRLLADLKPNLPVEEMVRESEASRDARITAQARSLLSQGKTRQARALLTTQLSSAPQSEQALEALFELYLNSGELPQAETLLRNAGHLPVAMRALMQAKLHTHSGDYPAALSVLNQIAPAQVMPENYLALRAGLLHKLQRHREAAREYRRLLTSRPASATYWLGLAVALDAENDSGALAAFEKVMQLASGSENYLEYVRGRVGTLEQRQGS
jgi:tetratricopeptide (TPR) repeat protein